MDASLCSRGRCCADGRHRERRLTHGPSENELQSRFIKDGKVKLPEFLIIPHRNPSEAGTPDLSITGMGLTSWWELKLARPTVRARGVQDIMLARLHTRGVARYLIFRDVDGKKTTHIVTPDRVANGSWVEFGIPDWHFSFIFDYVRSLHAHFDHK